MMCMWEREGLQYLQEALAGHDECELGTELLRLSLAAPHPLDQLGDVICHRLHTHTFP